MNREVHDRLCEGLGCNSLGLLTYGHFKNRKGDARTPYKIARQPGEGLIQQVLAN